MMRGLTILVVLAGLGWSGWWVAGRTALLRGLEAAAEGARDRGWEVAWEDLSVAGFPNRFDTGAEGLTLRAPDGAWGLDAPFLQVLALSYRPGEVIVVPGTPLALTTPAGAVAVGASDLRASATVTLAAPPRPARATIVAEALTAEGPGLSARLAAGQAAMREAGAEDSYDLALSLADLVLEGLDPALPSVLDAVEIDATATFDRPLTERPRLAALVLRRAETAWNEARADLTGEITIGPGGTPEGAVTLVIEGWRALLPLLTEMGVPPGQVALLAAGIAGLEAEGRAEIPLTLSNGTLRFGALPLAPLPRLPPPYSP